ncbi:hypothetical protein ANACOL_00966 [Anaerotruncus colihominis DSM 17241]|uniref:Uncharacterized protein n=1 Tax=Anaerotruncus colihominis DSM 17241 TaxID=445972 RepID=B0P877_9FIRM|nr:hypothetical protein ANACOL_00966 [Anaerotruncus colihominis DSM 17241]
MPPFFFIHILYAYMTPILNNHTLFSKNKKSRRPIHFIKVSRFWLLHSVRS